MSGPRRRAAELYELRATAAAFPTISRATPRVIWQR